MHINSIKLINYRNFKDLKVDLNKNVNIIIGDNAKGKTNILESIYLCATSKSNRMSSDKEIINTHSDQSIISINYEKNAINHVISVELNRDSKKKVAIDSVIKSSIADLFGNIYVVFFSPDDLSIVKGTPSGRRRFLDIEICQLDKVYLNNLMRYYSTLKQRNVLLKSESISSNTGLLDVYNEQLAKYGTQIINTRQKFIEEISENIGKIHYEISGKKENITIIYNKSVSKDSYYEELNESTNRDILRGATSLGPHRDDFSFILNDMELKKYGSRGQIRTTVLSLKLTQIIIIKNKTDISPVLLLDDVLSELDENRQIYLIEQLGNIQTIITGTGVEDFVMKKLKGAVIYKVDNDSISSYHKNLFV